MTHDERPDDRLDSIRRDLANAQPVGTAEASAPAEQDRPDFQVKSGELHRQVDMASEAISWPIEPAIYQRGGSLVRAVCVETPKFEDGVRRFGTSMIVQSETVPHLMESLTARVGWLRYNARRKEWAPIDCPMAIAKALLDRGEWPGVPVLTGLTESPTLRPDGTLLDRPGFDDQTGLLFRPNGTVFPTIQATVAKDDALEALEALKEPFREFPFQSEQDRMVACAAVLTGLVRRILPTAPMFGFSAPIAGTGKTLLTDLVGIIVTGRNSAKIAQSKNAEEQKKIFFSILYAGDQIICMDNCIDAVGGSDLCTILTSTTYKDRLLGHSASVEVPTNALFLATGNNLQPGRDMHRRMLICNLDPGMERPEERTFDVDVRHLTQRKRGELVQAGLTILRAYQCVERPSQPVAPMGGFETWSAMVRNPLLWLDQADPCAVRERVRQNDPERNDLIAVLKAWSACYGEQAKLLAEIVKDIEQIAICDEKRTALKTAVENVTINKVNAKSLGRYFQRHENKMVEGLKIQRGQKRMGTLTWRVVAAIGG